LVELGIAMAERCGGTQFAFVDPRRNDDAAAMVASARRLVRYYHERDVAQRHIIVSIPATEAGILAARKLESHGIQTNLILVGSLMHAATCAEAGATAISIAVGPLLDCYERKRKAAHGDLGTHPGVQTIQATLAYFRLHNLRTRVVGTHFRELKEVSALAGFDAVCLSTDQLEVSCWAVARLEWLPDSSLASLRARQAQSPTLLTFLESKTGIMATVSPQTKSIVADSMYRALGKMEVKMNALEKLVESEVAWQLALKTMDMKGLFQK
ncbi:hypothetical protein B0H10DRAFT_1756808, partial [Mycena sp. CBHHK59/15]